MLNGARLPDSRLSGHAGHNPFSVRTEVRGSHVGVPGARQLVHFLAGLRIPDSRGGFISRRRDNPLPIRAEVGGAHVLLSSHRPPHRLPVSSSPPPPPSSI